MTDFDKNNEFMKMSESNVRGRGARMGRDADLCDTLQQDSSTPAAKSIGGWNLFVTGVHEETSEEDLHDLFSEFGTVTNIHLNLDRRTCFVKGYALVEFPDAKSAQDAIQSVDGHELGGKTLHVGWAFLKSEIS
eukprot:TRINITY_DN12298_c1_g1_i1.p1 TRINITY_DN12298_c1_g1~~TRINITY_DN12298_c1_g1_i1.p1  ORF type:complete len:145 (+),score=19.74 TRINITY_DN12298_c1_g1_i1:34-435(+)